jgi:hypothetical protein
MIGPMPVVASYTIGSVREFLAINDDLRSELKQKEAAGIPSVGHPTTFRGQTNCKPLIPSLARLRPGADMLTYEQSVLFELQRRLPSPAPSLWEVAVIGRHHMLPTRFLDWSESPLVGLFFGVEEIPGEEAMIPGFVFGTHHHRALIGGLPVAEPWNIPEQIFLLPPLATPSVQTQLSILAAWPEPRRPFDEAYPVWRFEIPAEKRRPVQVELDRLGVNRGALFPDLTGACSYLAWKTWAESPT